MFQLVYTSTARSLFTPEDISHILEVSRTKNQEHGITGVLLYKSGSIVQVLEGDEAAVRRLYANIGQDPRHWNVATVFTRDIAHREFPAWTMGFNCVELEWPQPLPAGFNPIFHREHPQRPVAGRAASLLRTFVETVR